MNPARVLEIFKEITRIPRESGHEEMIIAYLQNFAAARSLECRTDEAGNVVIVRPASPGRENVPVLVLQSHSDMVCEKNSDVDHDFSKDPIRYEIRDGWMIAPDTTLGADCGIGMAAELAILESDGPTGRIECLFTVSEETGLDGAKALKPGFITGKTLINLDSEDEGELFVGCAGGLDTTGIFRYGTSEIAEGTRLLSFRIYQDLRHRRRQQEECHSPRSGLCRGSQGRRCGIAGAFQDFLGRSQSRVRNCGARTFVRMQGGEYCLSGNIRS